MHNSVVVESNSEIRSVAKRRFKARYWTALLVAMISVVLNFAIELLPQFNGSVYVYIAYQLLSFPFTIGMAAYFLQLFQTGDAKLAQLFYFYMHGRMLVKGLLLGMICVLPVIATNTFVTTQNPIIEFCVTLAKTAWPLIVFFIPYILASDSDISASKCIQKGMPLGVKCFGKQIVFHISCFWRVFLLIGVLIIALGIIFGFSPALKIVLLLIISISLEPFFMLCYAGLAAEVLRLETEMPSSVDTFSSKLKAKMFHEDELATLDDLESGENAACDSETQNERDENDVLYECYDDLALLLRYVLDEPFGAVTKEALAEIERLSIKDLEAYDGVVDRKILDLSPLAYCVSLKELDLSNCELEEVDVLGALTQLKSLILENNQIRDASPLSSITGLSTLDISKNKLEGLCGICDLKHLEILKLVDNAYLLDVDLLRNLTILRELDLRDNGIYEYDIKQLQAALPDCKVKV